MEREANPPSTVPFEHSPTEDAAEASHPAVGSGDSEEKKGHEDNFELRTLHDTGRHSFQTSNLVPDNIVKQISQDAAGLNPISTFQEAPPNVMLSLPTPPRYDLIVDNLTIGVPPPEQQLPLPIPISIPHFVKDWFKKDADDEAPKTIVRDVSTRCASGEMLVIIGGSGSGKTTVVNAIVGRLSNLPIESGEIMFAPSGMTSSERKALTSRKMKDKIGFVKQQDTLLSYLTVRETLQYAAELRLPANISKATRAAIVDQTIEELGLREAADTIVGGTLRKGISGGERRRLSIGCALVSMPSVLVADESTTGLDAFTSYSLLLTLSHLARRNRTVILTLHQPRSSAFPLFDRILLLSKGRVVFSGHRDRCLPWFASLGLTPQEHGVNPLDWLIDISTADLREGREEESKLRIETLTRAWQERGPQFVEGDIGNLNVLFKDDQKIAENDEDHTVTSHREQTIQDRIRSRGSAVEVSQMFAESDWDVKRIGFFRQTRVLLARANKNVYRNYGQMLAFACQAVGLAVFLGLAFYRLEENPSDIQSLKTLSFQYIPYYTYLTLIYWIFKLCSIDLIVFDREREDHLYAAIPWLISEFVAALPLQALQGGIFAIIVYYMCNMRPGAQYVGLFIGSVIFAQLGTTGLAYLAAAFQRSYATASLIANSTQVFFAMSAGFLLIRPPVYYRWVQYISVYYYGFRAAALGQFKNRTFACDGVIEAGRNQCEGNQVLAGLLMPVHHHPMYYVAGLIGLTLVQYALAGIVLTFYHPGGVKHAAGRVSAHRGKETLAKEDMDLVRQRVDLEVRGLGIKWVRRAEKKSILTRVNARFPSGVVTAVLGPSGAGKSTLLQLLAHRHLNAGPLAHFEVEGSITLNGQPQTKSASRALISFVEQDDDYHLPALTVRETLRYAAILRLPHTMSRKRKIQRAEEVLTMLGLSECADNMVGGELLKGISGGEKRRLSLAVEMINDPSILIVDEPTSGLDSMTANNVMMALKAIAESGRTVIVSIHQPRSDIWHAGIDNVILLAKGGRTAYSGPKDGVAPLCAEFGYPIPDDFNPADWILDLVSVDNRGAQEEISRARVGALVDSWQRREDKIGADLEETHRNVVTEVKNENWVDTDGRTPMYIALPVILERMMKNLWRQQPIFWLRLQQAPLLGCIFLLCFQRLKHGPSGAQDRIGFIIQMVSPISFVGVLNNVAIFPMDRDIYFHEVRSNGGYSALTFVLAFTLMEIPLEIGAALLFTIVTNIGGGMQTSPRIFFEFALANFALMSNGESFGMMFGCVTSSMGFNVTLVSTFLSLIVQICGVVSLSIPTWLNALAWGTTLKYAARIIFINENIGLRLNCPPETIASGECLVQRGEELLALFGFRDWNTGRYTGILVAVTVAYRIMAWAFVRAKVATL